MKKLTLYWRCQVIGWLSFGLINVLFIIVVYASQFDLRTLYLLGVLTIGGIFVSHLMKLVIKYANILNKSFPVQIVSLLAITGLFTFALLILLNLPFGTRFFENPRWMSILFLQGLVLSAPLLAWNLIYFMFHYVQKAKNQERQKILKEKDLIELETQALRSRVNPHFIFNCLNSIKSLIQANKWENATNYLTIFSRFIRTLFYNSDKRRITLFDELENCQLYIQLEAMRLNGKLLHKIIIDPSVDTKSVLVPALIIQPFVENAIWHGIFPKGEGVIIINVIEKNFHIICEIDDDGIGRRLSIQNKSGSSNMYEMKGVNLSLKRLNLENVLNESNASIETIDKYDNERPIGTKVTLSFNRLGDD